MGKDWLHWIGGTTTTPRRTTAQRMPREAVTSSGCMRAVFHLFDFPVLNQQANTNLSDLLTQETTSVSKGLEEPRNAEPSRKQETNFNLPPGITQIKTGSSSRPDHDYFSSESTTDSPGIKTPSVVARLMGLDLLPDSNSPRVSSSKPCQDQRPFRNLVHGSSFKPFSNDDISVLSLPETPRMSSARRSSSEFEHHRLSLQINKENNTVEEPVSRRGRRFRFQPQDENRSPGHYARQIVKQVKESVSRRVGLDITNTMNRQQNLTRRDENLMILKPLSKKLKNPLGETSPDRLKFFNTTTTTNSSKPVSACDNKKAQGITIPLQQHKDNSTKVTKNTSSGTKKLPFRVTRNKKEETFVHPAPANKADKKTKKTSILNISSPTLTITKLPQNQLPSKQSQSYRARQLGKRLTVKENVLPERNDGYAAAPPGNAAAEYGSYIRTMFKLAGVVNDSAASISVKWHSASHPIDPLIFHRIEFFHLGAVAGGTAALSHRCNRKLIFQLVDELLADVLKLDFHSKPWISSENQRFPMVEEICRKIDGFPAANCKVLEDIDSLIDKDLQKHQLNGDLEEERERIVQEIEGEIMERLVRETVAMVGQRCGGAGKNR